MEFSHLWAYESIPGMINRKQNLVFLIAALLLFSCGTAKKTAITSSVEKDTIGPGVTEPPVYHASNTLTNDLLHTKLEVSFDWKKKHLLGKANLTLTSYFYPTDILYLNARGMDLHEVSLSENSGRTPLKYEYRNDSLIISLGRSYKKGETYRIYIDYTAKPDELKEGGSLAITSDKGLYFINPDGSEPGKPRQIWTQGETQSGSAWFPTIDSPNERMTQEIYMTVDSTFTTLSNGLLISAVNNNDGTRTDHWKQTLTAPPYLTMMAVGKWSVVKDKWRDMEVSYYVEPEYEKYARMIFGRTPEMLEFFSKKLGYDYPWEKYAQVVVRDYVSGAMENASAVIYGEYIQQDAREYLDITYEDVIAHELFHHWFGDLVTCESWSNIPLNEGFATYGQYLWNEFKYGRDEADYQLQLDLAEYLVLGRSGGPDLIRYDYNERDEMFDAVSYQKGSRVLHMLRKITGDDAFFAALNLYLETNKFKPAEAHHLRLACEEVTGRDLNWFFNEWFFASGHPTLGISYEWNDSLKQQFVYVEQTQDIGSFPVYNLPVSIDLYYNDTVIRKEVLVKGVRDTIVIGSSRKPLLVNFDGEKMLLAVKNDNHTTEEWLHMLQHAPLYLDRYESLTRLSKNYQATSPQAVAIKDALDDKFWNIRAVAIKNISPLAASEQYRVEILNKLIAMSSGDPRPEVRSEALKSLAKNYAKEVPAEVYMKAANDSSYEVMGEAIRNYVEQDLKAGMEWLGQFEKTGNARIATIIASIYSKEGSDANNAFFAEALKASTGFNKYQLVSDYARFLARCTPETMSEGISIIEDVARNGPAWWIRMSGTQALAELSKSCSDKSLQIGSSISEAVEGGASAIEIQSLEMKKKKYGELQEEIYRIMVDIKKNETDKNLKKLYGGIGG